MDWLLPLRDGNDNEEARYAIRTWVANAELGEDDRLVTVGFCPTWLEPDLHLPGNAHRTGPLNVYTNVRDACTSGKLGEHVIVANDDMYAIAPVDVSLIYYRATLAEHVNALPQKTTWWASSLRLTYAYLRKREVEVPLSYELHRPLLVETERMGQILTDAWHGGIPVQWRSVYANLAGIGGEKCRDGKIVSRANFPPSVSVWSSTDASWRWVSKSIMPAFEKPTRWES